MENPNTRSRKPETGERNVRSRKEKGARPKEHRRPLSDRRTTQTAKWNPIGREGPWMQRVTRTKESQKKKRWQKVQQGEAREDVKKRKPTEQNGSHTEKRRGAQRQTMKPTQGNKWQAKNTGPGSPAEGTETNS